LRFDEIAVMVYLANSRVQYGSLRMKSLLSRLLSCGLVKRYGRFGADLVEKSILPSTVFLILWDRMERARNDWATI